jgi:DNA replication protein DnaC
MKSLAALLGSPALEGIVGADEGYDAAEAARERHAEAREVRDRLPPFLRTGTAAELEARIRSKAALAVAKSWHWGDGNVLMCGATREGKTTAAAFLFRRLLSEAVKHGGEAWDLAKWMRWFGAEELSIARKNHSLGHGDPPELVQACNARLLVLDDAGWDRDPADVCSVLNARYERQYPTIITTGKNRAELTAHYGAAVVRRMREVGGQRATVVDCFEVAG